MTAKNFEEPALFTTVYIEPEIRTIIKEVEAMMIQTEEIHAKFRKLHSKLIERDYTHGKL